MYKPDDLALVRKSWFRLANIPAKFVGWRLEDCIDSEPDDITFAQHWLAKVKGGQVIRAYGAARCGRGILFHGESGRGKSTIAAAILQDAITRFPLESFKSDTPVLARPCYFTSYVNLVTLRGTLMSDESTDKDHKLWHGIMGNAEDDAFNVRILVVDDVAKEHATRSGWEKNILHELLRNRYEKGLPTIITTNLLPADWENKYGTATRSFIEESFDHLLVQTPKGDLRLSHVKPSSHTGVS